MFVFMFVFVFMCWSVCLCVCKLVDDIYTQSMNASLTAPTKFTLTSTVTTVSDVRAAFQTMRTNFIRLCVLAVDPSWIPMLVHFYQSCICMMSVARENVVLTSLLFELVSTARDVSGGGRLG
jgi:hypothetical protein